MEKFEVGLLYQLTSLHNSITFSFCPIINNTPIINSKELQYGE